MQPPAALAFEPHRLCGRSSRSAALAACVADRAPRESAVTVRVAAPREAATAYARMDPDLGAALIRERHHHPGNPLDLSAPEAHR